MMYRLRDIRSGSCRAVPAVLYVGARVQSLKGFAPRGVSGDLFDLDR